MSAERAARLAAAFGDLGVVVCGAYGEVDGGRWDLVINATSASLSGVVPPLAASAVDSGTVCYDMAYAHDDTPFTCLARERGAATAHMGWGMLAEQAAEAFLVWRGVRPATSSVLALLRAGAA